MGHVAHAVAGSYAEVVAAEVRVLVEAHAVSRLGPIAPLLRRRDRRGSDQRAAHHSSRQQSVCHRVPRGDFTRTSRRLTGGTSSGLSSALHVGEPGRLRPLRRVCTALPGGAGPGGVHAGRPPRALPGAGNACLRRHCTAPDGSIPVESLDITARFDDGGEALVRLDALLAPMPRMTMMPASQAALRTLDRASGEMAQWLRARMTTLYPRKRATRLEVRWYRDTYRLQDGDLRRVAHEQVGASHVDFEP